MHKILLLGAFAMLILKYPSVSAQEAVSTTAGVNPPTSEPTPAADAASQSELDSTTPEQTPEVSAEPRRFHYGLQLITRGVYDDNINIRSRGGESDFYFAIEPVVTLGFGDIEGRQENYVRFDYAPAAFLFVDHSENDALQHSIRLEGQYQFARLTLRLSQDIAILDGTDLRTLSNVTIPGSHVNLDVSRRTSFQTYSTRLSASYDLTGKTFLSGGVDALITNYDTAGLIDSEMISGNLFINYRYSPKTIVGIGGTAGYQIVEDPNPNQPFEQVNARMSYEATGKLTLSASAGVEFRQFESSSAKTGSTAAAVSRGSRSQYISPVFELGGEYRPFDGTTITLAATRRTYSSGVLVAQDYSGTNLDLSVRQRFLQRFYLSAAIGYQNSDYFSTANGISSTRDDDYYFVQPAIDYSVTRFWTAGVYYLRRGNNSTSRGLDFQDNQVGARSALTF